MSAPVSKDFVDFYQVLEVDPRCTTETIQAAYERLAKRYAPSNPDTADQAKFAEVNAAFDILIDPSSRQNFDQTRGVDSDSSMEFPVEDFTAGLGGDAVRRLCLLSLLYYRRKYTPISPGITLRQAESIIDIPMDDLSFNIWVLKQKGLLAADDKSRLLITVAGIEHVEKAEPTAEMLRSVLRPLEERKRMEVDQAARQAQQEASVKEQRKAEPAAAPPKHAARSNSWPADASGLRSLGAALDKSRPQAPGASPAGRSSTQPAKQNLAPNIQK